MFALFLIYRYRSTIRYSGCCLKGVSYSMQISGELQEITPAWLTAALRTWGVLKQAQVTTIAIQPLNYDQGMTSQLPRLYVQYSQAEPGAPHTLIAKLPSADPTVREICFTLTGHYAREHY